MSKDHIMTSSMATASAVLIIAVVGTLIYFNSLHAPFILDDLPNIVENPYIRMTAITPEQIARIQDGASGSRLAAMMTFAANYYFHRYQPEGYHAVNILIHIITALLVFLVAGQTLRLCRTRSVFLPSLTGALLWLVHPVHTQSVTYIIQRMNSMAAMFYLLALLCYIKARMIPSNSSYALLKKNILFITVILAGILGLESKEIVATLPATIFLYEWFFFQDLSFPWLKKHLPRIIIIIIALLSLSLLSLGPNPFAIIQSLYDTQIFTLSQRILTEPSVIIYYISLLIFPHPARLNLDYDFPLSTGLFSPPETVFGLLTIFALLTVAICSARKYRLAAFAILWFLITLSIESSFIGLALIFEHRAYLPSIFPAISCVVFLLHGIKPKPAAWGLLATAICLGGLWTYQRNTVWNNEVNFWRDAINKTPHSARLYNNMGSVLLNQNDISHALPFLKKAVSIDPDYYKAYNNIGIALYKQGRAEESLAWYRRTLHINPDFTAALSNLAVALMSVGKLDEAVACCRQAVTITPDYAMAHNNLGLCLARQGRPDQAIPHYRHALQLNPELPLAHYNLGEALLTAGQVKTAIPHLQLALQSVPDSTVYLNKLAEALYHDGNYAAATRLLEQLNRQRPGLPQLPYNLACLYARQNNTQQALSYLNQAVKNGYADWQKIATDPDLASVRADKEYQQFIEKMEKANPPKKNLDIPEVPMIHR